VANILFIITSGLGVAGFFGFFIGHTNLVFLGGIAVAVEIVVGLLTRELRSLNTIVLAMFLGVIYSSIKGLPVWYGCMVGLCFESVITMAIGIVSPLFFLLTKKPKNTGNIKEIQNHGKSELEELMATDLTEEK